MHNNAIEHKSEAVLSSLKVLAVLTRVSNNTSKEASLLVHHIGERILPAQI